MTDVPPIASSIEKILNPTPEDVEQIRAGLTAYNRTRIPERGSAAFALVIRDHAGKLLGGLNSSVSYKWLYIETLWVAAQARHHGYGRNLVLRAEEEGRILGCRNAWLDTFSFQARGFYEKLGYTVFGQLDEFPPGHQRYFLRKAL